MQLLREVVRVTPRHLYTDSHTLILSNLDFVLSSLSHSPVLLDPTQLKARHKYLDLKKEKQNSKKKNEPKAASMRTVASRIRYVGMSKLFNSRLEVHNHVSSCNHRKRRGDERWAIWRRKNEALCTVKRIE